MTIIEEEHNYCARHSAPPHGMSSAATKVQGNISIDHVIPVSSQPESSTSVSLVPELVIPTSLPPNDPLLIEPSTSRAFLKTGK